MLDVIYTYKDKAGLVGFYLHVQRKKLDLLLDFIYMYKEKSWTCWILPKFTKKKAELVVWFYLHAQRKKLDLLDVIYIINYTKKKAGLIWFYLHYKEKCWNCCLILPTVHVPYIQTNKQKSWTCWMLSTKKKARLFFVEFNDCVQLNQGSN